MAERQQRSLKLVVNEASLRPEMGSGEPSFGVPNDISTLLAEERVRLGVEQREVASSLRIRLSYLQAIEAGRFEDLPGPTYAIGFIRAYASYLGLDDNAVVLLFKAQTGDAVARPELVYPVPMPEGRFPGGRVIAMSLLFAGLVYGGWHYLSVEKTDFVQGVPEVPARIVQSAPDMPGATGIAVDALPSLEVVTSAGEPGTLRVGQMGAAAVDLEAVMPAAGEEIAARMSGLGEHLAVDVAATGFPAPMSPMGDTLATAEFAATGESVAAEGNAISPLTSGGANISPVAGDATPEEPVMRVSPTQAATPPPASSAVRRKLEVASLSHDTPRVFGEENVGARIVLHAREDSWVQVRNRSRTVVLTRILRQGDSYNVPDEVGLTLLTGNAGGLALTVDGVAIPPLGVPGEVLRGIELDPDRLLGRPSAAEN